MRRPTTDRQNGLNWFTTVCVSLNPLILALCVVLFFVGGKGASEKNAEVIRDTTENSQPIPGEAGRDDLTIDYLRTLKPKVDSSAVGIEGLQASMLGATRKIDLIQEQVRDAGYTVTRVERKLIDEKARIDKIVNALTELTDAQEKNVAALKAAQDALAGMRFRQVSRDNRDIKRTLERRGEPRRKVRASLLWRRVLPLNDGHLDRPGRRPLERQRARHDLVQHDAEREHV